VVERRRNGRDYALALEAATHLIGARVALVLLPFRRIATWTAREMPERRRTDAERCRAIADVRWAVAAAAARLPGIVCFPRALAAQQMLRRRGIASTLTYGARTRGEALDAHVWITADGEGIVGSETAGDYRVLAVYENSTAGPRAARPVSD
jgi:hypothetical protein